MLSALSKRQRAFPSFKQFLETEMTWSQPIIVIECILKKIRTYVSRDAKWLKRNKTKFKRQL